MPLLECEKQGGVLGVNEAPDLIMIRQLTALQSYGTGRPDDAASSCPQNLPLSPRLHAEILELWLLTLAPGSCLWSPPFSPRRNLSLWDPSVTGLYISHAIYYFLLHCVSVFMGLVPRVPVSEL